MAGGLIRATTERECFKLLEKQVKDYWERLTQASSGRGVIAGWPAPHHGSNLRTIEIGLGAKFVRGHQPMATSEEVEALFEEGKRAGVLLGTPPFALVLGIQWLRIEQDVGSKTFFLRTYQYKYCLIVRSAPPSDAAPTWFALRLESDSEIGQNSWLLNHPIHHVQLGLCEELRIPSPSGRSLIAFVDSALRAFAPEVWAELYPSLYLELSEPAGRFAGFTQKATPQREEHLRAPHAVDLRKLLRQGRAENVDWHLDLEQWREDIGDHSECAPELFDVLLHGD